MNDLFRNNERGDLIFRYGRQAFTEARLAGENCEKFRYDVEEELYTDQEERSCYNCAYRRWTRESFACCAALSRLPETEG